MSEYNQKAIDFLTKTNTTIDIKYLKHDKYFVDDESKRDIYQITLQRGQRQFIFTFGQSINASGYIITIGRNKKVYSFEFLKERNLLDDKNNILRSKFHYVVDCNLLPQDTIKNPEIPSEYDILSCLTKYEPGTFENFCADYGYDNDSRKAEKIYQAVLNEWQNIKMLFTDAEIEELQEIC